MSTAPDDAVGSAEDGATSSRDSINPSLEDKGADIDEEDNNTKISNRKLELIEPEDAPLPFSAIEEDIVNKKSSAYKKDRTDSTQTTDAPPLPRSQNVAAIPDTMTSRQTIPTIASAPEPEPAPAAGGSSPAASAPPPSTQSTLDPPAADDVPSDAGSLPVLHATLVPDQEVVHGTPVPEPEPSPGGEDEENPSPDQPINDDHSASPDELPWWRQHQKYILGGVALIIIIAMAATIGTLVAGNKKTEPGNVDEATETTPSTISSPKMGPSNAPAAAHIELSTRPSPQSIISLPTISPSIVIEATSSSGLSDFNQTSINDIPSMKPTSSPSSTPTINPTKGPTLSPSNLPTKQPTTTPTYQTADSQSFSITLCQTNYAPH